MTKQEYLEQRNVLLAEADELLKNGNYEDCKAKQTEVESLDNKWEEEAKLMANLNAMKEQKIINLENHSIAVKEAKVVEILETKPTVMNIESHEYRDAFLKKLQGKELSQFENTAVTGAAAIPTITWEKIVEKMERIAPILSKVTVTQIPGNLTIPVEDSTADASWVAMGTASTDSADAITSVSLAAYKLIKTVELGADTMGMSIDAFEAYIVDKLAKKMAKGAENAVINGTGSSQPTGLLASGVITNTGTFTKAGMTYADLLAIIADLPDAGYRDNASFIMPSALYYSDVLPALTDKGSGLDVQSLEKEVVFKYPIILCDRVAADTIIFGDLSYYHFNYAAPVEIKSDASVGFRTGSTVYRAMALADGKVTNAAAFNKYTRALS